MPGGTVLKAKLYTLTGEDRSLGGFHVEMC